MSSRLQLDQFESIFNSALKAVFTYEPPKVRRALYLCDTADARLSKVVHFLRMIDDASVMDWAQLDPSSWSDLCTLIAQIKADGADFIVTERNLLLRNKDQHITLGAVVHGLTQALDCPVLVLPSAALPEATERVMVITDHLTGADALVNWGVQMTHREGTLFLAHVEDKAPLKRLQAVMDQMGSLPSEAVHTLLPQKLLELPTDYIHSVTRVLAQHQISETVVPIVQLAYPIEAYRALIHAHRVELLVLNSKDPHQAAMDALAHAIAVAFHDRPLLLL